MIEMVSNNVNVGSGTQMSFTENVGIGVDFKHQRMVAHYQIIENGNTIVGDIWAFQSNQTQYLLVNGTCSVLPLSINIPNGFPTNSTKLPKTRIGRFLVDVFSFEDTSLEINNQVLYDMSACAIVSVSIANKNQDGYAIANYFEYNNSVDKTLFDLPVECQSGNVVKLSHQKYLNTLLPNSFKLL
ncbi:hypothetical protein DLAC_04741 [Tieghemostelium lacteum]|uniref:Uncharacterized protein n=1 Tax=Tieghemostelium lacteum TaxID=361077 RepID=A0A151ZKY2_TIELA|nr:hypothetical protein DLAC_04741 [Tieghemostelium lacteum]|eukprot:KYQ94444.1 hypothetical protein DLAC_04741 [Tieghemostelium lacteum]